MKVIKKYILSIIIILISGNVQSNEIVAKNWLDTEINNIIEMYRNENIDKKTKLNAIQNAINQSFAGNGIARFVAGNSWSKSDENTQKDFVGLFKEHLYLTIGTLMEGYSNQTFEIVGAKEDKNRGVYLIDMEISHNDQKTLVTWRVKESKDKFYVIDLIIADISLVITKRAEFSSMLKSKSLSEINSLLKVQNAESYHKLIN